jgi:hypothetical protein
VWVLRCSGGRTEAGGSRFLFAELGEVDVELGVVCLGLDAEFVGAFAITFDGRIVPSNGS